MTRKWMFSMMGICLLLTSVSWKSNLDDASYKYMIQMINYAGEEAYVVVSLISPDGTYVRTLSVHGNDDEWYKDIPSWWAFAKNKKDSLDGITGASIGNGDRKSGVFHVPKTYIEENYTIRFESAVEDQAYFEIDADIQLNASLDNYEQKGKGWIRYVRLMKQ